MIAPGFERPDALLNPMPERTEELSYKIEIWEGELHRSERVVARAANAPLARAIFKAACEEHPNAHLVLRRGADILAERRATRPGADRRVRSLRAAPPDDVALLLSLRMGTEMRAEDNRALIAAPLAPREICRPHGMKKDGYSIGSRGSILVFAWT